LLWSRTDDLIYVTTEDGQLLSANDAFFETLGYDWADFQDWHRRWQHIHPEDRRDLADRLLAFLSSDRKSSDKTRNRFVTASGDVLWMEHRISKIQWRGQRHLLFISRDIRERQEMVEALRESKGLFRAIFEEAALGIGLVHTDGRVMDANPALQSMLGYTASELTGLHVADITHPEDIETDLEAFQHLIERRRNSYAIEKRYIRKDGSTMWARLTVSLVHDADDNPHYAIGMAEDISEHRRTEAALRESERRFRDLFENSPDAIFVQSYDGEILDVNPAACELHGMDADELIGLDVMETVPPEHREQAKADDARLVENPQSAYEGYSWTKDGHVIPVEIRTNHIDYQGQPALLFHVRDITARKRTEARLAFLADHDHLTQLYNRRRFEDRLEQALQRPEHDDDRRGALLWIDVDRFKAINDRHGYQAGDALLLNLAAMLRTDLGHEGAIARVGGDEFAMLLTEADRGEAEAVAAELIEMSRSYLSSAEGDAPIQMTISIGVALIPQHSITATDLLAHADRATRDAKEAGGNCYRVFVADPRREVQLTEELNWAERIRDALENDGFQLYRQSVWDLAQERSHGAELLLRLTDNGQEIRPGAFLEAATRFGLMIDIDYWVVGEAIRLLAEDQRAGEFTCFEVNLSAKAIGNADLLAFITSSLETYDADPTYLTFEITETDAIYNVNRAVDFIHRLKALGCKFALDDFGVGFSTFYHLKHLPVDYLKIDGDFVQNIAHDRLDQHIVRSIVH
ncbi:MAG: PAS domain S-box protein, partial [Candidatus Bipolaricaulia bacterium]